MKFGPWSDVEACSCMLDVSVLPSCSGCVSCLDVSLFGRGSLQDGVH